MQTIDVGNCKIFATKLMEAEQISAFTEKTYQRKQYTAIEVFPTNTIIAAQTKDTSTNLTYLVDVPSCDTLLLHLYCRSKKNRQ